MALNPFIRRQNTNELRLISRGCKSGDRVSLKKKEEIIATKAEINE